MENALLVGLSRQMALSNELDIVANNIANIDTTGYKSDNAQFGAFLMPDAREDDFSGNDRRVEVTCRSAETGSISARAHCTRTGNPLDVAISGNAFTCRADATRPALHP